MLKHIVIATGLLVPLAAQAQPVDRAHSSGMTHVDHSAEMEHTRGASAREPGQGAFAAIQEIVALLDSDADTDWTKVNIDALREHLIDMENVTLHADVSTSSVANGQRYLVTGAGSVRGSIERMINGHAETMDGVNGMNISASVVPKGTMMTVTVDDPGDFSQLVGLGFIGVMGLGTHHQDHHLMVARGEDPHQ